MATTPSTDDAPPVDISTDWPPAPTGSVGSMTLAGVDIRRSGLQIVCEWPKARAWTVMLAGLCSLAVGIAWYVGIVTTTVNAFSDPLTTEKAASKFIWGTVLVLSLLLAGVRISLQSIVTRCTFDFAAGTFDDGVDVVQFSNLGDVRTYVIGLFNMRLHVAAFRVEPPKRRRLLPALRQRILGASTNAVETACLADMLRAVLATSSQT